MSKQPKGKDSSCYIHGMKGTPIYSLWSSMKSRCYNKKLPTYKYYGGRGIKVCDRWHEFKNFFDDMGLRPEEKTLDRIDNNSDYSPENCRWATIEEQSRNRRDIIIIKNELGEKETLQDFCVRTGVNYGSVMTRVYKYGYTHQEAIEKPFVNGSRSKLTKDDVDKIKKLVQEGVTQREIAEMFGLSQTAIYKLKARNYENKF